MHFPQEKEGEKRKRKNDIKKKKKFPCKQDYQTRTFFGHVQTELMPAHTDKRRNLVTNEIQSLD